MTKVLSAIFWFMLGGFVAVQFIVQKVVSPGMERVKGVDIEPWLAVYNLYDYIIPYTVFFLLGTIFSFIAYASFKYGKFKK